MDTKQVLTRKAAAAQGAVFAFLHGKLAQDSNIDLTPLFTDVTADNYADRIPEVAAGISRLARGHLAKDAKLDGLREVLLAMDEFALDEEDNDEDKKKKEAEDEDDMDDDDKKKAEDRRAKDEAETEEEKKVRMDRRAKDKKAWDASEEETDEEKERRMGDRKAKDKRMGKDEPPPFKDKPEVKAEDVKRAVDHAVSLALDEARREQSALREAERAVRPYVGEIAVACDSADAVYATALKMRGIDTKGIHPSAYPAMLKLLPLAGARVEKNTYAQDAAISADFNTRHPEVARIRCV